MRILAWNIQWFTLSRVEPSPQGSLALDFDDADRTVANRTFIYSTVKQADPDVFVLLEARCTWGTLGTLAPGDGPEALLILLRMLRMLNANWCLVPPLRVNPTELDQKYTETIGVYFRSDRLDFTGPLAWPLAPNGRDPSPTGPPIPPGPGTATSYPSPWAAALPQGNVAAAQYQFYTQAGAQLYFTESINRRPYLTTFVEKAGMKRTVRMFSVHLPPKRVKSRQALSLMTKIRDADSKPGPNQLTVIVGDTNVNLNGTTEDEDVANVMKWQGYVPVFPPRRKLISGWWVYPPTIIRSRTKATPDDYKANKPCYDYGYVWYGQGAKPPSWPGKAVAADRVAGVAATDSLPGFTHDMRMSLDDLRTFYKGLTPREEAFRERWNYGHISRPDGTSDHLPVFLVV
jgi:hypothetical protein